MTQEVLTIVGLASASLLLAVLASGSLIGVEGFLSEIIKPSPETVELDKSTGFICTNCLSFKTEIYHSVGKVHFLKCQECSWEYVERSGKLYRTADGLESITTLLEKGWQQLEKELKQGAQTALRSGEEPVDLSGSPITLKIKSSLKDGLRNPDRLAKQKAQDKERVALARLINSCETAPLRKDLTEVLNKYI